LPGRSPADTFSAHDLETMDLLYGGDGGLDEAMAGVKAPGEAASGRQRKRYTQDDLRRRFL
jgi:hypothetical protein